MSGRVRSLSRRLLLASTMSVLLLVLIIAPLLYFSFRSALQASYDGRLESVLLSLMASVQRSASGGIEQRRPLLDPAFDRPGSGWYWQVNLLDSSTPPLRSRSLWDRDWPIAALAQSARPSFADDADFDTRPLRVAQQRVRLGGSDASLQLVVVGDVSTVYMASRRFAVTLALAVLVLAAVLLAGTALQVRYGLKPLRRVRGELERVREGSQDALEQDYPAELAPLALQINELLQRNRTMTERARQRTGDLAHALKLPLSRIHAEVQAPSPASWPVLAEQAQRVQQLIDHHLTLAASAAQGRAVTVVVAPVCEALVKALQRIHAQHAVRFTITDAHKASFRGDPQDLEEMLGNLLDNAWKWTRTQVTVTLSINAATQLQVRIEDDGPGLPESALAEAMQRGVRFDERTPGSGLGLHIVAQLATDYGGSLVLEQAAGGGLCAVLRLPAG